MNKKAEAVATNDNHAMHLIENLKGLVARWPATRLFIVASAVIFLLLLTFHALHFWPAILGFAALAALAWLRSSLAGDAPAASGLPMASSSTIELARGTGLAILNGMPDPLIVLDGEGKVLLRNKAAAPVIGSAAIGRQIAAILRNADIIAAVEDVLKGGAAHSVDYRMPVPVERQYDVLVMPIELEADNAPSTVNMPRGAAGAPKVLILLRDLTNARRVEAMRVDFVAFASHELKTPLASLSGFIETLRGHAKNDPEAQARFLDIMSDQAERMRRLIDDLLSLSRIELHEHVRPAEIISLPSVIGDVVDGLNPVASQAGVEIAVNIEPDLPAMKGDRNELAQVVQNLVDNALRYGRSGKRVEVNLASDTKAGRPMLRLAIRDFGEGIARQHLPRLTERFYRVDDAASRAKGGTGLGLAIVKHIVSRHEGTLAIESELSKGTTFTVFFPTSD